MNPNAVTPENAEKFVCMACDFKCSKESDFVRHALTRKHKNRTNPNAILTQKNADKVFACNCGKIYKHMSSLCNHKKIAILLQNLPTKKGTKKHRFISYIFGLKESCIPFL